MERTDENLIQLAFGGNRQASEDLATRYRKLVFQVAMRALGNIDDANDVAQETLIYGLQRLGEVRDRAKFASWIRNVTLSRCADYRRRRRTRRLGEPITLLSEASEETDYAEALAIRRAFSSLTESHRTTLLLHYEGGYSVDEVATLLDIRANTVRSRLMAAKHKLRKDLLPNEPKNKVFMPTQTNRLPIHQLSLIESEFPGAKILSVYEKAEPWSPLRNRALLSLSDGREIAVEFRDDLSPEKAALLRALESFGIPVQPFRGPFQTPDGGWLSLCDQPRGENLLLWALGGTPHRIRLATERAFQAIGQLEAITPQLLEHPVGAALPKRTLLDELEILTNDERWAEDAWLSEEGKSRKEWLSDPWFLAAIEKVKRAAADIHDPLVYTHYLFSNPLSYRIEPESRTYDEPLGAPGDPYYSENPLVEFSNSIGYFGDPLLGLAMVWIQDCYPFVHTGYVEQFLWRRGATQRDFAPRLGIKGLQMIARELPVVRPEESRYWDSIRGWVEQALRWL